MLFRSGVSLVSGGNFVTLDAAGKAAFTEVFANALKNAQGGTGTVRPTAPTTTGLYDPKTKQGKVFTETDLIEYGKGDPVVFGLGKLIKATSEQVDVMRSMASKMGAQVNGTSDSVRYLRRIERSFN